MNKFPFVLKDEAEAEEFVRLVAGHYYNQLEAVNATPGPQSAIALGAAMRAAIEGIPDDAESETY